jgi:hypothetical protein
VVERSCMPPALRQFLCGSALSLRVKERRI